MSTLQATALTVAMRAVFALAKNGYGDLAAELEREVAALSDEANNQRVRAEAAEDELRELRKERTRG